MLARKILGIPVNHIHRVDIGFVVLPCETASALCHAGLARELHREMDCVASFYQLIPIIDVFLRITGRFILVEKD